MKKFTLKNFVKYLLSGYESMAFGEQVNFRTKQYGYEYTIEKHPIFGMVVGLVSSSIPDALAIDMEDFEDVKDYDVEDIFNEYLQRVSQETEEWFNPDEIYLVSGKE